MFLASNQDAINSGMNYGFNAQNSLNLSSNNSAGAYRAVSQATERYVSASCKPELKKYKSAFTQEERIISGPNNMNQSSVSATAAAVAAPLAPPPPPSASVLHYNSVYSNSTNDDEYGVYDQFNKKP